MALDGNKARRGHFRCLIRAEVRRDGIVRILVMIRSERNADGEDRRLHAVFLQNRIGQRVIAPVPVVKGNDDRLFGKRLAPQDICLQFVKRNAGISGLGQRPDLRLELLR